MSGKKPDQVVYNEDSQRYEAFLKPYGTDLGAPAIKVQETATWKRINAKSANAQFKASFEELKTSYANLLRNMEMNELVYNAKFSFEPVVGKIYYLYRNTSATPFLSILTPHECSFDFVGSFRLNSDKLWEAIETSFSED